MFRVFDYKKGHHVANKRIKQIIKKKTSKQFVCHFKNVIVATIVTETVKH